MGNHAVVSRVTDRPRPGRAMVRGKVIRQRKSRATKPGVDMVMSIRKFHMRHRTGKPMKRNKAMRHRTGKLMKRNKAIREERGKPMKIKTVSNKGISKPMRRKRDIKGPRINNPMGPREAVLTEKNST